VRGFARRGWSILERAEAAMFGLVCAVSVLMVGASILADRSDSAYPDGSCANCPSEGDQSCQGVPVVVLDGSQWANMTLPYNVRVERNGTCDVVRWSLDSAAALAVPADEYYFQVEGWNATADRDCDPNVNFASVRILPAVDDYELALEPGTLDGIVEIAVYWDIVRREQCIYGYSNFSRSSLDWETQQGR